LSGYDPQTPKWGLKSGLKKGFEFQNFDKLQKLRLGTPIWGQGVKKTKIIFNLD